MKNVKIISASAGSGKTTRLAEVLRKAVVDEQARPDAVLATTFTNKAAAELRERARQKLLEAKRFDDAHRLLAARIGTVNSVCSRFVRDFAFELGLSPKLEVLDETLATDQLNRALSAVVTPDMERDLAQLKYRMEWFEWRDYVRQVVQAARNNDIVGERLNECATRSIATLTKFFGAPEPDGSALDASLAQALGQFVAASESNDDKTKTTDKAVQRARSAKSRLRSNRELPWREWASLATLAVGKKSRGLVEPVQDAAVSHDRHPRLHQDLSRAITLVFEVARLALENYQAAKRRWGIIDFVDQEVLALKLLRLPQIREELRGEIDLVLVDEFQDTSPLQLAIFLELADIAPASVWVGDQKQAIYAFRGTDPALMDAALEELLESPDPQLVNTAVDTLISAKEPETLKTSWRSRPELVHVTSDVFAPAFRVHGIPEERTRLEPGLVTEPNGLGPIVEYWPLTIPQKNRTSDLAPAVANGILELLSDNSVSVRDPLTGAPRPLGPEDVAILCRTNKECNAVALALESLDLRAIVPRAGLLDTLEGRLATAALRLWIDENDSLARAELARAVAYADEPDAWLGIVLGSSSEEQFSDLSFVKMIRDAKQNRPECGATEALDAALMAIELRQLCSEWGEAPVRLANIDAFRSHAVRYTDMCSTQRIPATPGGLLTYLLALRAETYGSNRQDLQAVRKDGGAVFVSTWHRAKGLEWPVTILFGLEKLRKPDPLGVHVASEESFDINEPLRGRWIRFWPTPYSGIQKGTPFKDRIESDSEYARALTEDRQESLRLLYVGWTRARDRLVLAAQDGKLQDGILGVLAEGDASPIEVPGETTAWAGRPVEVKIRPTAPAEPLGKTVKPGYSYPVRVPVPHPPAFTSPSALEGKGSSSEPIVIGVRRLLKGSPDMTALGNALHGFLATDRPDLEASFREKIAEELLQRWGVDEALRPDDLLAASEALRQWVASRWPQAVWHREFPVEYLLPEGTIVRGTADLVLEEDGELVVLDHKTYPGSIADAMEQAKSFAGQLVAYGQGIEKAIEKEVTGYFVHMPVSGVIIPLTPE